MPKLIDDWRQIWRYYSTHAFVASVGIGAGLAWLAKQYPVYYAAIPDWVLGLLALVMLFGFVVARIVQQAPAAQQAPAQPAVDVDAGR